MLAPRPMEGRPLVASLSPVHTVVGEERPVAPMARQRSRAAFSEVHGPSSTALVNTGGCSVVRSGGTIRHLSTSAQQWFAAGKQEGRRELAMIHDLLAHLFSRRGIPARTPLRHT